MDASNGLSTSGAVLYKTASAGKQSTLFGVPPPVKEATEKKASNRGRKRKSDAAVSNVDGEDDCVEVTSIRKQPKNLQSFFAKPTSASTTSSSKKAPGNKKARSSSTSDIEESEVVQQGQEQDDDDMEATQEQDQEVPPMDGDNTSNESIEAEPVTPAEMEEDDEVVRSTKKTKSPAKDASSMSKLAAFKFSASTPAAAIEEEPEAQEA